MGTVIENVATMTTTRVRVYVNQTLSKEVGHPMYSVAESTSGRVLMHTDNLRLSNATFSRGVVYGRLRGPLRAEEWAKWRIIDLFKEAGDYVDRNSCLVDESPFVALRPDGNLVAVRKPRRKHAAK